MDQRLQKRSLASASASRRHRQRGMTTMGFIILAAFVGLFAFAFIRLTPVYLNYMKVAGVVEGVYEEFDGQNPSSSLIRNSIIRRFSVESITVINQQDVKVTQEKGGFLVRAEYDHTVPFIANISFSVHFDSSKLIRR
jgi:hypothetical protein